mmetsp:Transcript_56948/g.135769  ORF Transcript_56948/g.135769 Transcript_56948/m.135769 type:complete len:246 (+) Transcript_56948:438-1175(+)
MRRCDYHVQARVGQGQSPRLRQGIQEIEGGLSFRLLLCLGQLGRRRAGQQRLLRLLCPPLTGIDDGRPEGIVGVKLLKALVHFHWHLCVVPGAGAGPYRTGFVDKLLSGLWHRLLLLLLLLRLLLLRWQWCGGRSRSNDNWCSARWRWHRCHRGFRRAQDGGGLKLDCVLHSTLWPGSVFESSTLASRLVRKGIVVENFLLSILDLLLLSLSQHLVHRLHMSFHALQALGRRGIQELCLARGGIE